MLDRPTSAGAANVYVCRTHVIVAFVETQMRPQVPQNAFRRLTHNPFCVHAAVSTRAGTHK